MAVHKVDTTALEEVVSMMSGEDGFHMEVWHANGVGFILNKNGVRIKMVSPPMVKQFVDLNLMYRCTPSGVKNKYKTVYALYKKRWWAGIKELESCGYLLDKARRN